MSYILVGITGRVIFFFLVMFNLTSARPDFNGAVQCCNTVKPAYNCTMMDQSFGFMLSLLSSLLLLQASSISHRLSSADWCITVSSQAFLDTSQDPLNTI